jgi:4-amino-4-deoxy-L-arabinose transferase-like glycosyltransferase
MTKNQWWSYLGLGIIFIVSLLFRIPNLDTLPIDAHPHRQTDVACAIHYFTENPNILYPRSCLIRPVTNTEGLFFLEFPLYEWLMAMGQLLIGATGFWLIRVINLILFTVAFWCLYSGCKNYFGKQMAFFASFIFAFLPSGMFFFGRALHPDVLMVATLFASWLFLTKYLQKPKRVYFIIFLLLISIAIATRPFVAIALPAFSFLLWQKKYKKEVLLAMTIPFWLYGLWAYWQSFFPEASSEWEDWIMGGQVELLKLETWKWLVWKNVVGEVMGKVTTLLAIGGLLTLKISQTVKKYSFCLIYLLMVLVYWLLIPLGNLHHQYYAHVFIFPIIILSAKFLTWVFDKIKIKILAYGVVGLLLLLALYNGWHTSRYFLIPRVNDDQIKMAEQIKQFVPSNSKVIYLESAPYALSLAYRQGFADFEPRIETVQAVVQAGYYLVTPNYDYSFPKEKLQELTVGLTVISQTDEGNIYLIN